MLLPLLGLLVGVLAGLVLNVNVGFELSRYSAVAILAAVIPRVEKSLTIKQSSVVRSWGLVGRSGRSSGTR